MVDENDVDAEIVAAVTIDIDFNSSWSSKYEPPQKLTIPLAKL
jgi:hypothetical protein